MPGRDSTAVALSYNGGTLDPGFSGDGRYELTAPGFTESSAVSVAIDSRDRIVISGILGRGAGSRWFVARLLP